MQVLLTEAEYNKLKAGREDYESDVRSEVKSRILMFRAELVAELKLHGSLDLGFVSAQSIVHGVQKVLSKFENNS